MTATDPKTLSVASWNMHWDSGAGTAKRKWTTSAGVWDIACLQEVSQAASRVAGDRDGWKVISGVDMALDRVSDWKFPHGAALVARNGWTLSDGRLVDDTPTPGRA